MDYPGYSPREASTATSDYSRKKHAFGVEGSFTLGYGDGELFFTTRSIRCKVSSNSDKRSI